MTEQDASARKEVSLLLECDLDAPIETVWRALSEPELLAQWLLPNDITTEQGGRFTLAGGAELGGPIACEILASDAPHRLSFSWRGSETHPDGSESVLDTVLTFELSPVSDGRTHLRLVHGGFVVPADYPVDIAALEPEILVYLPLDAVARRRIRKPRRAALARGALPVMMRLAA
ncbi:SRPBCC domain-containing protein [Kaistia dalseonensis]|uniref:Uncharacterized protein YndB with AHSA1/START domain n=1 Tax=Kaistia dalseonensis TaxID=410840 RepID=A0ABU0H5S7_9HYPH|nr:SRPBCC domain-containing protein [Kaistia dalseonensis]MCX5494545.1 SRPBCC domain-containing protein [Kaistia dalseonensis]MDQ0437125.1 uncharacterized protein YndB with AHSA1/START domain [Kaistia dalseonensis]